MNLSITTKEEIYINNKQVYQETKTIIPENKEDNLSETSSIHSVIFFQKNFKNYENIHKFTSYL